MTMTVEIDVDVVVDRVSVSELALSSPMEVEWVGTQGGSVADNDIHSVIEGTW